MSRLPAMPGWSGAVAQMGERCNRTAEVRGSIPLSSTILARKWLKFIENFRLAYSLPTFFPTEGYRFHWG